jgi:preprotein translocase SecE subunit
MKKILLYLNDIVAEMKKVVWPTQEALIYSTVLVIVISMLFAVYILVVDKVLNQIVGLIL